MVDDVHGDTGIFIGGSAVTRPWVYARRAGLFGRMLWGCAIPCGGVGNKKRVLVRSTSTGNVLWRNWIVSGAMDSCELI